MQYSKDRFLPWLALKEVPGIGNLLYKKLIDHFGSPERIFDILEKDAAAVQKITVKPIDIKGKKKRYFEKAAKTLEEIKRHGFEILTLADTAYPSLLKEIPDPPPYFTYTGRMDNDAPCFSIVGSRNATGYGLAAGEKLAYDLAGKNFHIVSGMARGIDTSAHKGALKAGGRTYAVLGSGLNVIYPAENRSLFSRIKENGAVLSEFGINQKPEPGNFPVRNRVIAGMSAGTCVVEAAERSGSLITARLAGEFGREVFAVPGSINSAKSRGTHRLIRQGAKLVETDRDITEELAHFVHEEKPAPRKKAVQKTADGNEKRILAILDAYPVHLDTVAAKSGMDTGTLLSLLLTLEIKGLVKQAKGKYFYKAEKQE